jgi:hypothetical protein
MAAGGDFEWPPTGRFPWPPSPRSRARVLEPMTRQCASCSQRRRGCTQLTVPGELQLRRRCAGFPANTSLAETPGRSGWRTNTAVERLCGHRGAGGCSPRLWVPAALPPSLGTCGEGSTNSGEPAMCSALPAWRSGVSDRGVSINCGIPRMMPVSCRARVGAHPRPGHVRLPSSHQPEDLATTRRAHVAASRPR